MRPWSKLPTWWYKPGNEALIALRGGLQAGESQAALRVYLALAATPARKGESFSLQTSLSTLEDLTRLSRSMVLKGVRRAVAAGLIDYSPGKPRQQSLFGLLRPDAEDSAGHWAKLPTLMVHERVPRIPRRGASALIALKIYLAMIAARPNNNAVVAIRHDTLRAKTGCQTDQVRAAVSILANEGLLHVLAESPTDEWGNYRAQRYHLLGRLDAPRRWDTTGVAPEPGGAA